MANSFGTRSTLAVGGQSYTIHSLSTIERSFPRVGRLPFSLKILLENLLRHENGLSVRRQDIEALANWDPKAEPDAEIGFTPARVLLQDFTGVPAVVDLAAMRDAMADLGGDPNKINPLIPCELVIDHSVQVDDYGTPKAFASNSRLEYERNRERYRFLRWGQNAFRNFSVVPPETGIVPSGESGVSCTGRLCRRSQQRLSGYVGRNRLAHDDDQRPRRARLGRGRHRGGSGHAGPAGHDADPAGHRFPALRQAARRRHGHRPGADGHANAPQEGGGGQICRILRRRASANCRWPTGRRSPTCRPNTAPPAASFPVDAESLHYLRYTGRPESQIQLVEAYFKEQGMFHTKGAAEATYSGHFEPGSVHGCAEHRWTCATAGSSQSPRCQEVIRRRAAEDEGRRAVGQEAGAAAAQTTKSIPLPTDGGPTTKIELAPGTVKDGSVVIAAITSCTNTSNPDVMMAAGLLAKKAVARGLITKPWVKTSLAPGSKVATDYLAEAGLMAPLQALRFHVVGYGCTTCIGNSGPLPDAVSSQITDGSLVVASVLSGNRNFEGRVHGEVRANYLASPPLVVAYALTGRIDFDWDKDPIGLDQSGQPVFLKDIWPSRQEVTDTVRKHLHREQYERTYSSVFEGDENWKSLHVPAGSRYEWDDKSTYIALPPFFQRMQAVPPAVTDIAWARVLAYLGDSITTDHISPAGNIKKESPAGKYLIEHGVEVKNFNSYGSRRGNHEVMMRGTFANVRLKNLLVPGVEGGVTRHLPTNADMPIYDAAMLYAAEGTPLVILAGKEYGSGSSRDWAAKGTRLLGVRAVIAESYERIHRSNLIGMGVLPLQFKAGESAKSLELNGAEAFDISGIADALKKVGSGKVYLKVKADLKEFEVLLRVDTPQEELYYEHGGILQYVLRQLVGTPEAAKG